MREMKFRVWDKIRNRYPTNVMQFAIANHGKLIYDKGDYLFKGELHDRDNYVVEQFTGLQDSEGVDIYEGNVYETEYNEFPTDDYMTPAIVVVEFFKGAFVFKHKTGYLSSLALYSKYLGTVNENPELLKQPPS